MTFSLNDGLIAEARSIASRQIPCPRVNYPSGPPQAASGKSAPFFENRDRGHRHQMSRVLGRDDVVGNRRAQALGASADGAKLQQTNDKETPWASRKVWVCRLSAAA